jgi:hypothetical protein
VRPSIMAFTVRFSDELMTNFSDDFEYDIEEDGILVIREDENRIHYAAHAWISVENDVASANPGETSFG